MRMRTSFRQVNPVGAALSSRRVTDPRFDVIARGRCFAIWLVTIILASSWTAVARGSWVSFRPGEREPYLAVAVQASSLVCAASLDARLNADRRGLYRGTVVDVIKGNASRNDVIEFRMGYMMGGPMPNVGDRVLMLVTEEPEGLRLHGGCYGMWSVTGSIATTSIVRPACSEEVTRRVSDLQ